MLNTRDQLKDGIYIDDEGSIMLLEKDTVTGPTLDYEEWVTVFISSLPLELYIKLMITLNEAEYMGEF